MHDGYIFILGVAGSASSSHPAPALLDTMLAALPPVKRAALLGEVMTLADAVFPDDPLALPILADIADAELLFIVTPLPANRLPARLAAIVTQATQAPVNPAIVGRQAIIVGICTEAAQPNMALLETCCQAQGFRVAGMLFLQAEAAAQPAAHHAAAALARHAYTLARSANPQALPHEVA